MLKVKSKIAKNETLLSGHIHYQDCCEGCSLSRTHTYQSCFDVDMHSAILEVFSMKIQHDVN